MNRTVLNSLVVLAVSTAPVYAQTESRIMGLTASTPLVVEQDTTRCQLTSCAPVFPPFSGTTGAAGGSAWDATRGAVWHESPATVMVRKAGSSTTGTAAISVVVVRKFADQVTRLVTKRTDGRGAGCTDIGHLIFIDPNTTDVDTIA